MRNPFSKKSRGPRVSRVDAEHTRADVAVVGHRPSGRFVDRLQGVSILTSRDGADFVLVNLDAVQAELDAFPLDPAQMAEYEREALVRRAVNNPANWLRDPATAPDARYAPFEIDRRLAQIKFVDEA